MSVGLNSVATEDTYREHTTLDAPFTRRVNLYVASTGGAVAYQLGTSLEPGVPPYFDGAEIIVGAGAVRSVDRACDGVRVRSAVAGVPALVTVEAVRGFELPGGQR